MVRTIKQLGLTEELAATPVHVDGEMWTVLEAARYIYRAHRDDNPNIKTVMLLAAGLDRLQQKAENIEDTKLIQTADALKKEALTIFREKL